MSVSVRTVIAAAAEEFGLLYEQIEGHNRDETAAAARQAAIIVARRLCGLSSPALGRAFGGRDHTTVGYSIRKANQLIEADADFAARVVRIMAAALSAPQEEEIVLPAVLTTASGIVRDPRRAAIAATVQDIERLARTVLDLWEVAAAAETLISAVNNSPAGDSEAQALATSLIRAISDMMATLRGPHTAELIDE